MEVICANDCFRMFGIARKAVRCWRARWVRTTGNVRKVFFLFSFFKKNSVFIFTIIASLTHSLTHLRRITKTEPSLARGNEDMSFFINMFHEILRKIKKIKTWHWPVTFIFALNGTKLVTQAISDKWIGDTLCTPRSPISTHNQRITFTIFPWKFRYSVA